MIEKNEERKLDQFYTNNDIAKSCFDMFLIEMQKHQIQQATWLEPSAGSGSFYNIIPNPKLGLDIDPKSPDIQQADFLTFELNESNYITIGNPPFGKNSSLAIKFFNKCANHSQIIGFIVPKTFKKNSVVKKLHKNMHLVFEWDVPDNSFNIKGEHVNVPCVFQIWIKKNDLRVDEVLNTKTDDISFVSREQADIAFQRVGVKAGAIKDKSIFHTIADASHIFIKLNNPNALNILQNINWDKIKFNTAGNPSISKSEMIHEYNIWANKLKNN